MASPAETVRGVAFDPDFDVASLAYDEGDALLANFLHIGQNGNHHSQVTLLGFGAPFDRSGGFDESEIVADPITDLADVPAEYRTIDLQGKGVGPRMYSTPQAALGFTALPHDHVNAYLFDIAPAGIKDARPDEGSKLLRIGRHAGRIVHAKLSSLDGVVDHIHGGYGDAAAVLMTQPPRAEMRQRARQDRAPAVASEFLIIRRAIPLVRVGHMTHALRAEES